VVCCSKIKLGWTRSKINVVFHNGLQSYNLLTEKILFFQDCSEIEFSLCSYRIPTRIWDTFAEPNNLKQYRVKLSIKIRPHPDNIGASPKKQVNRRRLRLAAAQNLSIMGFRNTSPDPVGFFICQPEAN
jgi:hypothetical protein